MVRSKRTPVAPKNLLPAPSTWTVFLLFLLLTFYLHAQTSVPTLEVDYLSREPIVDGRLDNDLSQLPVRTFLLREKSDPKNPDTVVNYRIAYSAEYFYLYVEMDSPTYTCRDRGYQNGDGFSLVLGRPLPKDIPTNDYYVFGFSAQDDPARKWQKAMLWNRDYDARLDALGPEVRFAYLKQEGKVGFEVLLPWQVAYPYHPWMQKELGFNLFYVEAVGAEGNTIYSAFPDSNTQEQSDRYYLRLRFQQPTVLPQNGGLMVAKQNHVMEPGRIALEGLTWSADEVRPRVRMVLRQPGSPGAPAFESVVALAPGRGVRQYSLSFDRDVPPGTYSLRWSIEPGSSAGEVLVSMIPMNQWKEARFHLESSRRYISQGSAATLDFRIQEVAKTLREAKFYDPLSKVPKEIAEISHLIGDAERGTDTLANTRGYLRRGLRSADGTLQPYSMYIPEDLDRKRKYPLLVYLHGSSRDDTELSEVKFLQQVPEFLVLAPFGRGMSNFYLSEESRKDVLEAIADASDNYPVDPSRIVLSGFSMGGYGVYRMYDYAPSRFVALAVLGGEPSVDPGLQTKDDKPDYSNEKLLPVFSKVPIFIFHGRQDMNAPFKLTEHFVERLRPLNPRLVTLFVDGEGHHIGASEIKIFLGWLQRTIGAVVP